MMRGLRLLADDLTGALDSAAAFGTLDRPVPVRWDDPMPMEGSLAIDSGTRDAAPDAAAARMRALAPLLAAAGPDAIAYKKIDSLLRGNEVEEILALHEALQPELCVIAPAFPAQNRVTRGGRQFFRQGEDDWRPAGTDLVARLEAAGRPVLRRTAGEAPPASGFAIFDAETDGDLERIARSVPMSGRVLFVGSGGLAGALARGAGMPAAADASVPGSGLSLPILGLVGTDHASTRAQLAEAGDRHETIESADEAPRLRSLLERRDAVFVSVKLPLDTPRGAAAERIETVLGALARQLDPPGTLFAAGGETLRRLCRALGATGLDVCGEIVPGVPRSILRGGRWNDIAVISKSGAFGGPGLLRDLVAPHPVLRGLQA